MLFFFKILSKNIHTVFYVKWKRASLNWLSLSRAANKVSADRNRIHLFVLKGLLSFTVPWCYVTPALLFSPFYKHTSNVVAALNLSGAQNSI